MADDLGNPRESASVFTSQMLALIALAQALVDCGAVKNEVLIAHLERQRAKMGIQPQPGEPITSMISSLKFQQARK